MLTSFLMFADIVVANTNSGMTWTPETFYVAAGVVQLIAILLFFRITHLPSEYNTFINVLFVIVPTNAVAFFMKDMGLVGVLSTGFLLIILLGAVTRGDMFKALGAWVLVVASYWAVASLIVPAQHDLYIEDLGGIAQVVMEGGLEQETLSEDELPGSEKEDDRP